MRLTKRMLSAIQDACLRVLADDTSDWEVEAVEDLERACDWASQQLADREAVSGKTREFMRSGNPHKYE